MVNNEVLEKLEEKKNKLNQKLDKVNKKIKKQLSKTIVYCTSTPYGKGCGAALEIRNLTYIQTHWYEEPYGCTGGATWRSGEGQFDCPICNHRNRLYNRPEIEKKKHLFGSIINEYKD